MRWLALLALLLAWPRAALASENDGTPARVTSRLVGTSIQLTARFELDVEASTSQTGVPLSIPSGAVITSGVATVGGRQHALSLVDADAAEKEIEVFGADDLKQPNRRWTVRVTGGRDLAVVDLVAPEAGPVVLDLTLEMPSCFFRDRRYALVPNLWFAHFTTKPAHVDDRALDEACAADTTDREWISFAAPTLALRPAGEARIGAFAGRLPLGHDDLARVELDLASELTHVPLDLHTAIVFDHSRSLSGDEVENERAVISSYMQRVPAQSRVQVIAYARDAKPLLPAWLPASTARARIDREIRALAPRNGSNVDAAITEAGRWLSRAKGTRRLIVISDDRFAARIQAMQGSELKKLLPANTLVHVVVVSAGTLGIQPTDPTELGGLAELTEGIAVSAGVDEKTPLDASILVHPIGVDRLAIKGRGWEDLGIGTCASNDSLAEGRTCTAWMKGTSVASAITVEAFLWGHKITRTLVPDATDARHLARELSARSDFFEEDLRKRIDRAAFAVNDAWSLIARWGGTPGRSENGGFGFGRSGFGPGCCSSSTDRGVLIGSARLPLDLKSQVTPVVDHCKRQGAVSIWLQTTMQEIVDLTVDAPSDTAAVRTCIEEGLWELALSVPNAPWQTSTAMKFAAP